MQLICLDGRVIAHHEDGQAVPLDAYKADWGAGVALVPYAGRLDELPRIGPEPDEGAPDNRPHAAPEVTTVPASVSRAQAKIALHRAGLLDMVKEAVSADPEVKIWFDDALVWERQNPHIIALGNQLIGDAAGVDALFIAAAQIAA